MEHQGLSQHKKLKLPWRRSPTVSVCVEERNLCTQSLNSPQNPVLLPSARPRGKSFETSRHSFSWRVTKRDEWMMICFKPSLTLCSLFWFNEFVCKFAPRDRSTAKQKRVDQFYARRIFSREQTKLRSGTFFCIAKCPEASFGEIWLSVERMMSSLRCVRNRFSSSFLSGRYRYRYQIPDALMCVIIATKLGERFVKSPLIGLAGRERGTEKETGTKHLRKSEGERFFFLDERKRRNANVR